MPALRLFGRRWLIAEDDIPLWLILPVIFQLIELILLITWLALAQPEKECPENINGNRVAFEVATFGLLATLAIVVFCEACISLAAFRGSIFEQKKREIVRPLLEATLVTYAVQLGFNVLLTVLLYDEPLPCTRGGKRSKNVQAVLFALTWTTWGTVIGIVVLGLWFFNFFPDYMDSSSWSKDYMRTAWMCCGISMIHPRERRRQRDKSVHIGETLACLFGHIDYTRSDFIVSFYLAMVMQRCKRENAAKTKAALQAADDNGADIYETVVGSSNGANGVHAVTEAGTNGTESNPDVESGQLVDVEALKDAVHFFRHAFAVYGWDLYVLQQGLVCGMPKVCCTAGKNSGDPGCGALPGCMTPWRLNFKVAEEVLSIGKQNILFYRDAGQRVDVVPYIISVDVQAKAIVLAIRGATTLDENALDLMLIAANLDIWLDSSQVSWDEPPPEVRRCGSGDCHAAHIGYLTAARATLADVQKEGVLRAALDGPTARFPDYKLVVVGHSLGAALAFLMSLRLRHLVPSLKCYCFSVPGCVASQEICAAASDWCTSIVLGQEFFPRYTAANLDRMRDEMVMAAARCRKPKATVILWWFFSWFYGKPWKENELFYSEDQIPDEVKAVLQQYRESLDGDLRRRELLQRTADLTLPGRLIYMRESSVEKVPNACCGKKTVRKYQAVWKDPTEFLDEGILLDTRLLLDHLPNISFDIMKGLVEDDNDEGEHVSKGPAPAKAAVTTQAMSV